MIAQPDRFGDGVLVAAVPLTEVDETLQRLLVVEGLVLGGVLLLLGAAAWVVVRVGLLPLDRMGHTAGAIAGGDLSRRVSPTDPRTEVGRLGIALNAMLDRLEQAFAERQASEDRLRRFIADASHELRTPLASIRGYAELFRMGAAREPDDVARSMERIEDEAARMGVLVEDLLTLARLDQVPDVPHVPVDLGDIARDAVDDARATAPDRAIELRLDPPAGVTGDPHQLRQVLANLLRNALVHTPGGHGDRRLGRERAGRRARRGARPRAGAPPGHRAGRPVRALLACGGRPRARPRRGGARARDRGRHRRRPRRPGARRERRRGRRRLHRRAARGTALRRLSGGSDRAPTSLADAGGMTPLLPSSTRRRRRLAP